MNSLPPTLSAAQLSAAFERIERMAKAGAADSVAARRIWNECRKLRAEAERLERVECAMMAEVA